MLENIVAMLTRFVENFMVPGFDFNDIIGDILTVLGLIVIF